MWGLLASAFVFTYGLQELSALSRLTGCAKQVGTKGAKQDLFGLYLEPLRRGVCVCVFIYIPESLCSTAEINTV